MTLGLAVADAHGIYLAIESEGLPTAGSSSSHLLPLLLDSKILQLQTAPEVTALCAGGLAHWLYVADHYKKQPTLVDATTEIMRLLDGCMSSENQAYGLICGFENIVPKCYRINCFLGNVSAIKQEESLDNVRAIGDPALAQLATVSASHAIGKGTEKLLSLVEAIQQRLPAKGIRGPIHVRVMHYL